jgi:hypothetical protein
MDFISGLSDDQKALLGCFAALVTCASLMSLSSLLGGKRRSDANVRVVPQEQTDMGQPVHIERPSTAKTSDRKAA